MKQRLLTRELKGLSRYEVRGDARREITHLAPVGTAGQGAFTFCETLEALRATGASVVVVPADLAYDEEDWRDRTLILANNPRLAFVRWARVAWGNDGAGIHPLATVYGCVQIGECVTIGAGCVIGGIGYGYVRNEVGARELFPHVGKVIIGDDVALHPSVVIDRGALEDTVIGRGTKIDAGTYIAHGCQIGADCMICAHVVFGSRAVVGDRVWIGPNATIRNGGICIGDDAFVGMGAVVTQDVPAGETVMGNPAWPEGKFKRLLVALRGLVK